MKQFTLLTLIAFLCYSAQLAGQQQITGKVTSTATNGPIFGVAVSIKGTSRGTTTDLTGNFSISASSTDTLVFSSIEYITAYELVGNRSEINMALIPDIKALSEIVVVGYGAVRKIDVTGSVSSVKTDDIPIAATTSVDKLLQGRAAGLNLTSRSAQPGGAMDVSIRGDISPRGSNSPLYVIDGVPLIDNKSATPDLEDGTLGYYGGVDQSPLNTINPADIESIDILKDASAAAIYGSAAANGVILITTKKGQAGEAKVEYRGSYTIQTPKEYYDLLNAREFREQHNRLTYETWLYNNEAGPYGDTDLDDIGPFDYPFTQEEIDAVGEGTDWLDLIMRNGSIQEHNLSISGGTYQTKVYTSLNYYDNKAILKNSDFKRITGRVNLDQEIGERVKMGINLTFSQINANNAATGTNSGGEEKYNMLQAAYAFAPDVEVYDENGNYTTSYDPQIMNPAAFLIIDDKQRSNRFIVTPKIEAKLVKNLKLIATGGMDRQTGNRNFYLPVKAQRYNVPNGMGQISTNRIDNYSAESYLNYTLRTGNHNLTVVAGAGYYKTLNDGSYMVGRGYFSDALGYNNIGVGDNKDQFVLSSYRSERTKISQFFRINYTLSDRYILSFVGRRDGSSIFSENKKYGFFPGISGAWRIDQEDFMASAGFLSELKLRGGYGTSGNESVLANNTNTLYETGYNFVIGSSEYTGVVMSQLANPDLSWETDITVNVGIDFGLFRNRITGSVDYFVKSAKDLLDYSELPSNNPVGLIAKNVGTTRSKGVEFLLHSNNVSMDKFKWTTDLTLSTFKAYWVERNPETELAEFIGENDEIHAIYGWETDGIIKSEADIPSYMPDAHLGNIKYVDQNGDGVLDVEDVVIIGNIDPKWTIGFGNTFTIGNFDLNIFFYGMLGRDALHGYRPGGTSSTTGSTQYAIAVDPPDNVQSTIKDIWSSDNTDGIYPGVAIDQYSGSNPAHNHHLFSSNAFYDVKQDFYLQDASFLRLKNITLGYTIPKRDIFNLIESARLYVDLQNVFVLTNYEGFDPEYSDVNPYPQAFSTTFGINLTF